MYPESKLLKVAELYYIGQQSQSRIAADLGLSGATISRMLKEALARGIVQVHIHDPLKRSGELEWSLREKWGLDRVVIVDAPDGEAGSLYKFLGKKTAELLPEYCRGEKTLGIGCGRTIFETMLSLDGTLNFPGLRIVPLMGGWGVEEIERDVNRLVSFVGQKWRCRFQYLLTPAVLSAPEILEAFLGEPQIRLTTDRWESLDAALFSIGPELCASNYPYLNQDQVEAMRLMGGVGDVLGRVLDRDGKELDFVFNHCLTSIPTARLKRVPLRIGVGGGWEKIRSLRAALTDGLINFLITDNATAVQLMQNTEG
jgi:deoxyribonucleoside regulator